MRAVVFKRSAGFRITVGTSDDKGYHTNRQGLKKPILIWAEEGTEERRTKSKKGTRRRANRLRSSHRTGKMKRYGFMERTLSSTRETVTDDIRQLVEENVLKIAQKYGCK